MTTKGRKITARPVIMDVSAWDNLGKGDFSQKRGAFGQLLAWSVLPDSSTEHQLTEIGDHQANREQPA